MLSSMLAKEHGENDEVWRKEGLDTIHLGVELPFAARSRLSKNATAWTKGMTS